MTEQTTVTLNGVAQFTPRMFECELHTGLSVWMSTTEAADKWHYAVGIKSGLLYMSFKDKPSLPVADVLLRAHDHLLLWIRPQLYNDSYSPLNSDRDFMLSEVRRTLQSLTGVSPLSHRRIEYREQRFLEIPGGDANVYDIRREYIEQTDQISTIILELSADIKDLPADATASQRSNATFNIGPAWLDPGDFLPGVWTPNPNDEPDDFTGDVFNPDNIPA